MGACSVESPGEVGERDGTWGAPSRVRFNMEEKQRRG